METIVHILIRLSLELSTNVLEILMTHTYGQIELEAYPFILFRHHKLYRRMQENCMH